jgi:predicted transcriptional regulator
MGLTKSALFSEQQNQIATMAKAFSHPARVAILQYLLSSSTCVNGDLVKELGLAQPTISQHLKELKSIGIIQGTIEGVSICYCINAEKWAEIRKIWKALFEQFDDPDQKCC